MLPLNLHPNSNGGVRQLFQGDGQDRLRAYQYFHHERSPQVGDGLMAIYEKWNQDMTMEGELTNCFLRYQGDILEDTSICKLAMIATRQQPISYGQLLNAFYQKLNYKEASTGSTSMNRISPSEIDEIWSNLSMMPPDSIPGMPLPAPRQLPTKSGSEHPSFNTIYNQVLARHNFDMQQGHTPVYSNNFSGFVQQPGPLAPMALQPYQPSLVQVSQPDVNMDMIWSDLSRRVDESNQETWSNMEKHVSTSQAQFKTDLMAELKSTLKQEISDTLRNLLKQEITQECQQEIDQKVNEAVKNIKTFKLKKNTKDELKHELKADLLGQINQAVKREMLEHTQKEMEASFKDELYQTLRGSIGQDVISRLLQQDSSPNLLLPDNQMVIEEDHSSQLQEISSQTKRLAPQADMGQGESNKRSKVENIPPTKSASYTHRSMHAAPKDQKVWAIDRFESKNNMYETGNINLVLDTTRKTLSLRIINAGSFISLELTHFFKTNSIRFSPDWVTNDILNYANSIWLKFSHPNTRPAAEFAQNLHGIGFPGADMMSLSPVDDWYTQWTKSNVRVSDSGSKASPQDIWPIRNLHTGNETFTGNTLQLALSQDSKSLSVHIKEIQHKLDTSIEQVSSCRYAGKMLCLDFSMPTPHAIWIITVQDSSVMAKRIGDVANIKIELVPNMQLNERYNSWKKENGV